MANSITLKNWYQLDFELSDGREAKNILLKIDAILHDLQVSGLAGKWFFLFEGNTVRVRIESRDKTKLKEKLNELATNNGLTPSSKLPFSEYQESDDSLFNEVVVKSFAEMMSEATKLTIGKLKGNISFDNYRLLERVQHCLFNNMLTLGFKPEEAFLISRLYERTGKPSDKDFENKI